MGSVFLQYSILVIDAISATLLSTVCLMHHEEILAEIK